MIDKRFISLTVPAEFRAAEKSAEIQDLRGISALCGKRRFPRNPAEFLNFDTQIMGKWCFINKISRFIYLGCINLSIYLKFSSD